METFVTMSRDLGIYVFGYELWEDGEEMECDVQFTRSTDTAIKFDTAQDALNYIDVELVGADHEFAVIEI